ncbi:MAG TPA: hypothetical protein VH639_28860 [Bryobacteraceae bacterium]|jgi:hypothetical protein
MWQDLAEPRCANDRNVACSSRFVKKSALTCLSPWFIVLLVLSRLPQMMAAPDKPLPPDQALRCAKEYATTLSKLPAPKDPVQSRPAPGLLDGCVILERNGMFTIVPAESVLYHGSRSSVNVEKVLPRQKKYLNPHEFFTANPNEIMLVTGAATANIGHVSIDGSFEKNEVKTAIAVDQTGTPACKVDLK